MVYKLQQLACVAYVRTSDFGHVYVDIYAHFFPYDFFMIFILFKTCHYKFDL